MPRIVTPRIEDDLSRLHGDGNPIRKGMQRLAAERGFPIVGPLVGRHLQQLTLALGEFLSLQDQLEKRMTQADGLDLGRVRVSSPISRSIKMSLGQSFALVLAHERRHLWQARQVRGSAGFPGA